jgi:hypothetical protein
MEKLWKGCMPNKVEMLSIIYYVYREDENYAQNVANWLW